MAEVCVNCESYVVEKYPEKLCGNCLIPDRFEAASVKAAQEAEATKSARQKREIEELRKTVAELEKQVEAKPAIEVTLPALESPGGGPAILMDNGGSVTVVRDDVVETAKDVEAKSLVDHIEDEKPHPAAKAHKKPKNS